MSIASVRSVLIGFVLLLGIVGCQNTEETNRVSPENSVEPAGILSKAPQPLSPSTAFIDLRVTDRPDRKVWSIEVQKVLGYGSSTPMLSPGRNLQVEMAGYFSNSKQAEQYLLNSDQWRWIIQYRDRPEGAAYPAWTLTEVVEVENP